MLHKFLFALLLGLGFLFAAAKHTDSFETWPQRIKKPSKYSSTQGFELGRALFYDPILSKDSSISCASCHLSYTGFAHVDHPTSHGIEDRIGRRNAPGLFNLAWRSNFHWDGGVLSLNGQAINPLTHPDEMGSTLDEILKKLRQNELYKNAFRKCYKAKQIETWMLLDALTQFTLALESTSSYYDKVQQNQAQFNAQQARGFQDFQTYCNRCHQAPLFFTNAFEDNGIEKIAKDFGRFEITGIASDKGKFRVPTLRNISHTFPYMHDGRFKNLKQVLAHYADLYQLNDFQQKDIIAFLKTLTDSSFLSNPNFQYHPLKPKS
ncbi:MAG: Cytochrome peroxidase [Bacteroidota bacterium]|jgi:cytochrome c peroxidase